MATLLEGRKVAEGIYELTKPRSQEPALDIVLFHGLSLFSADQPNSYYKTWKGDDGESLADLLNQDFDARVLSVSWNSNAFGAGPHWKSRADIIFNNLRDVKVGDKPTVFVGHSLGGLMMKQVVISFYLKASGLDNHKAFMKNLRGMVFIATPHKGSELANLLKSKDWKAQAAKLFAGKPSDLIDMLEVLRDEPAWLSNDYRDTVRGIKASLPPNYPLSYALYETKPTEKKLFGSLKFSAVVVSMASATSDMDGWRGVDADHLAIAQPPPDRFGMYGALKAHLEKLVARLEEIFAPISDSKNVVVKPPPINGLYIKPALCDEVVNHLHTKNASAVCIVGSPGLGKSAMARELHDEWLRNPKLQERYSGGVVFVEWGPSTQGADQYVEWLAKLTKPKGLASQLGCKVTPCEPPKNAQGEFDELCELVLQRLHNKRMLVIVEDVWKDDFGCFNKGLSLLTMRSGSCCVVTSRHGSLVSVCPPHFDVTMTHDTIKPKAVEILCEYASVDPISDELKEVVGHLAAKCDGSPLMMALVAGAVRTRAQSYPGGVHSTAPWQDVLKDLSARLAQVTDACKYQIESPLMAYAMSVECLNPAETSVVLALRLFPPTLTLPSEIVRAVCERKPFTATSLTRPSELVRAVWQRKPSSAKEAYKSLVKSAEARLHRRHPKTTDFETVLETLHLAAVLEWRHDGVMQGVSFHWLLSEYLKTRPEPAKTLPGTDLETSIEIVRAMVDLGAFDPRSALELLLEQLDKPDTAFCFNEVATKHHEQGRYLPALPLYQRALEIDEAKFGMDAPGTATSLNNLASLYQDMGRHTEALPLYERALRIKEAKLGAEHPSTATSLNNLAGLYDDMGRHAEAEPLYQRALRIREAKLGPDHPDTAASLNNLALLYVDMGRHAEAESLYEQSLRIREAKLGPDHPGTATALNNLAGLYNDMGRHAEAEPLYERALRIDEVALGPDHPGTATALNNLAGLYEAMGRYAEALPLCERALQISEAKLGAEHPSTATSLNNLTVLYYAMGRHAEAEPLFERALRIREAKLGAEHPDTATSLNDLAMLYDDMGMHAKALPLYERALRIREDKLGADHSETAQSLNNLANLYRAMGRHAEAEPLYERALRIKEAKLGAEHPSTATSLNNLAGLYEAMGRHAEAEPLYQRALRIDEAKLGAEHPSTAVSLNNLAGLYEDMGRHAEAESLFERALRIREAKLGPDHS